MDRLTPQVSSDMLDRMATDIDEKPYAYNRPPRRRFEEQHLSTEKGNEVAMNGANRLAVPDTPSEHSSTTQQGETDFEKTHQQQEERELEQEQEHQQGGDEQQEETPATQESAAGPPKGQGGPPKGAYDDRSRKKIAIIMFSLCMAVFLAALDVTIVTTALPTIASDFADPSIYTWVGSAYLLGTAAAAPIWGKLSDIYGRKPTLLTANVGFLIGSLLAGLAINPGMLITARAIQGIAGGGLVNLVNIVIGDLFSPRRRGAYYGVIGGVWAIASSLGPIVGGAFTEKVTWRWCFYINLPVDGLAFVIIFFFLDLKTPKTPFWAGIKAIDWPGALLIIGGTLMFLFGIEYGGATYPWDSTIVICLLVFGVVSIILFGIIEWKVSKYPIIPIRIFRHRSNIAALGVCFFHGFTFIGTSYYLPLYFQAVLGATPILSGVYVLASSVALSFSSIATGIFIRKTGLYLPPIYLGLILMTLGVGLYINFGPTADWPKVILYQVVAGVGIGPLFQAPLIALQSLISPRDIATATSTFGFTRTLASAIGIVIGQTVFQNEMAGHGKQLANQLGPMVANLLGGGNAGSSIEIIDGLSPANKAIVRSAYASSLSRMWILYTCSAAAGLLVSLLITKQNLTKEHEETSTGLAAQEAGRQEAKREEEERRRLKREAKAGRGSVVVPSGKEEV